MRLKATQKSGSGLNTQFVNLESGRHFSREHVVAQIERGNPNYRNYTTVTMSNGTTYVRSKPDKSTLNNIE